MFLQVEQSQLSKPSLTSIPQSSLWLFARLAHVSPCLSCIGIPRLDIALQMRSHHCWVEDKDHCCDQPPSNATAPEYCWPSLLQGLIAGLQKNC